MTARLVTSEGVEAFSYGGFTEDEAVAFLRGLCLALDLPEDWCAVTKTVGTLTWTWQGADVYEVLKLELKDP